MWVEVTILFIISKKGHEWGREEECVEKCSMFKPITYTHGGVNFMCLFDGANGCPDIWSNIILGVL